MNLRTAIKKLLIDRKSKLPRVWSNEELRRFSHLFEGRIVNVSAWRDEDKEGKKYEDYFVNKMEYTITNYEEESRGIQGLTNEVFLDLTDDLDPELIGKFDVVFNHTVLEHIFEVHKAFTNLCLMSSDVVILVVPFLQPMHADYGDYWRFTPSCLQKLFEQNGMTVLYCSANNHLDAAVYIFCIASKNPAKWSSVIHSNLDSQGNVPIFAKPFLDDGFPKKIGTNSILNLLGWLGVKYSRIRSRFSEKKEK